MVECAWGATRCKDGLFKRKFLSLIVRKGRKKALVATGHKILIAVYHVLKNKEAFKVPQLHDDPKRKQKQVQNHLLKLRELGFDAVLSKSA